MSDEKNLDIVNRITKSGDESLEEKNKFNEIKHKATKENLPKIIEERKQSLIEEINNYIEENDVTRISYAKMYELMSSSNRYNRTKYSAEELFISFQVYKSVTSDISKANPKHFPNKQGFCNFIGISTSTYDAYKTQDDNEIVEVINRIDDYLTDVQLTMAQTGLINPGATMFRMKTEHGYVEPSEMIQINNEVTANTSEIRQRLMSVRNKTNK